MTSWGHTRRAIRNLALAQRQLLWQRDELVFDPRIKAKLLLRLELNLTGWPTSQPRQLKRL